ncbi:MAG TPA: hypothetical protein VNE67_04320 [Acetobacteraceae bacterium]|nr:hypothetical protein [Acetobacteraceae bacterium]
MPALTLPYASSAADERSGFVISNDRIARAKRAYTTRHVPPDKMRRLLNGVCPAAGDLVLARVARLGQHEHIERPDGRRARMWEGDEIIVAYGNRYAPDQFEAYVPDDLDPCHLVAGGGVASRVVVQHSATKRATEIVPLGLLANAAGERLNLIKWGLAPVGPVHAKPYVFAVLGSSMNAGKTTAAAAITRGLSGAGYAVGAAKATGTGAGGDRWAMVDAGAKIVLDFTDAGHPSTFGLAPQRIEQLLGLLIGHVAAAGVEAIVIELADGLFQEDTAGLVESGTFGRLVDGVVFASNSAMGAKGGADWLRARSRPLLAISGVLTTSPLAAREAAKATGLPVLSRHDLSHGTWWTELGAGPPAPPRR